MQHGVARAEQKCLTIGALRFGVTRLPAETEREIRPRLHVTGRERERDTQLLFGFRVATLGAEGDPELAVEFRVVRPQGHRTRKRRRRGRVVAVRTERQSMARVKLRIVGPQRECIRPCLGLVAPTALALIRRREHAIRRDPVGAQAHGLAQRALGVVGAPQALQRDAKTVVGFGGRRIDRDGFAQRARGFREAVALAQGDAGARANARVIGRELCRLAICVGGLEHAAAPLERPPQPGPRAGIVGMRAQRVAIHGARLRVPPLLEQHAAELAAPGERIRRVADDALGIAGSPLTSQHRGEIGPRHGVARVQTNRLAQGRFGVVVPSGTLQREPEVQMAAREVRSARHGVGKDGGRVAVASLLEEHAPQLDPSRGMIGRAPHRLAKRCFRLDRPALAPQDERELDARANVVRRCRHHGLEQTFGLRVTPTSHERERVLDRIGHDGDYRPSGRKSRRARLTEVGRRLRSPARRLWRGSEQSRHGRPTKPDGHAGGEIRHGAVAAR